MSEATRYQQTRTRKNRPIFFNAVDIDAPERAIIISLALWLGFAERSWTGKSQGCRKIAQFFPIHAA